MFLMFGMGSPVETVYDNSKLNYLLKKAEMDSVQKIERLSALEFHKLINNYRIQKGKNSLQWNNDLWLAARNHNAWMVGNNKLSHSEIKGTINFTGEELLERTAFVLKGKFETYSFGENVLYHFTIKGRNITEISKTIALTTLNQWKKSKGHNENMLDIEYKIQGIAFCVKKGRVWATELLYDHLKTL